MKLKYCIKGEILHYTIESDGKRYVGKGTSSEMWNLIKYLKGGKNGK